ncbi:MAG TPA: putative peptidoglycan binding domain-containing protein [Desulfosporosinus sp.]|nr:putative peptidoglycan binding domain-containing protein [Desulfosporosinus sp.]
MGDIRGVVTANIEDRFRKLAMKKFGYRKGSLSQALEEAIRQWIESNKIEGEIEVKVENPA